jgi:uncharacterized membrane protein
MQGLLRFIQLLTMTLWVGGLSFFAFILAPTAFSVLPTQHEAGLVVGASLRLFDIVALVVGGLFLGATALLFRQSPMRIRGRYEMEFLLAGVMLLATAYVHFNVEPSMEQDRLHAGGDINAVAVTNPARIHFDALHKRSERAEGGALLLGLLVLFLMSREQVRVD